MPLTAADIQQELTQLQKEGDFLSPRLFQEGKIADNILWLIYKQMSLLTQLTSGQTPDELANEFNQGNNQGEVLFFPPQRSVDLEIKEAIRAGSSFGSFQAQFDGMAILSINLSAGGVISVVEQKLSNGHETDPTQLLQGTKLNAGQEYDIPFGILNGNKYRFQSDTTGYATSKVVSYQYPIIALASGSSSGGGTTGVVVTDIPLTTTTQQQIVKYTTGPSEEPLEATLSLDVINSATTAIAFVSWTDPHAGPVTFDFENGGSLEPNIPHGYDPYPFTAAANSDVYIMVTANIANQMSATASIEKQV